MKGTVKENLELLKLISSAIASEFGNNCEVVIHDYSLPFENSIIHIENGHVTDRRVGDSGSSIGLQYYKGHKTQDGKFNYLTRTKAGKVIKSTTVYLKSDEGEVIGSMCINYDVTDMMMTARTLDSFLNVQEEEADQEAEKVPVYESVNDMLASMIEDSIQFVGVPVAMMDRTQKIAGIKYLQEKGAFAIKNAAIEVANSYNVSKFTVYNYLNEIN